MIKKLFLGIQLPLAKLERPDAMIKISIQGPIASGKTTIGNIIEEALSNAGYNVEHYEEPVSREPGSGYIDVLIEERKL
jgi:thymidylate kinase